jgi:hypothetical protein
MTNDSNRIVKDLVKSLSEKVVGSPLDRPDSPTHKFTDSKVGGFDKGQAEDLLEKLIEDIPTEFFVANETETELEAGLRNKAQVRRSRFALAKEFTYYPSRNPQSADYVPRGYVADSRSVLLMINPQLNFEAEYGVDGHFQSVIVAAENMELQSVNIVDRGMGSTTNLRDDMGEDVAKYRKVLKLHNAQFFVARSVDILNSGSFDMDNFMDTGLSGRVEEKRKTEWPVWAPIECLVDQGSHTGYLQRVMDRTSMSCHRDKMNPLYVNSRGENDKSNNAVWRFI